jgi:hypothetical protein
MAYDACRHCGKDLLPENVWVADGCGCNSGRGINHGLVATATCTCPVCDPDQTGASRYVPIRITSMSELDDGRFCVRGTCHCGLGASMTLACILNDGSYEPCCNKCARGQDDDSAWVGELQFTDKSGRYVKITKEMFEHFSMVYIMTS